MKQLKKILEKRILDFIYENTDKSLPRWHSESNPNTFKTREYQFEFAKYALDRAVHNIKKNPTKDNAEFEWDRMVSSIPIWEKHWSEPISSFIGNTLEIEGLSHTDAFKFLYSLNIKDNKTAIPKKSFAWTNKLPLEKALDVFKPLSYLFADNRLEGLRMAFSEENIYNIKGCIKPSKNNQTAILYLLFNLVDKGYIKETDNMEETIKILLDTKSRYRSYKSQFKLGEYTLKTKKDNLILEVINNLSE